jgi:hypothetical protein
MDYIELDFTLAVLGLTIFIVLFFLITYPKRSTPLYIYFPTFISWSLALGIIVLLPYDIYMVFFIQEISENKEEIHKIWLDISWKVGYWTLMFLTWIVLPVTQNYVTDGEFSFLSRLKSAVLSQLIYLTALAVLGTIFFGSLLATGNLTLYYLSRSSIPAFAIAASNSWGLLLLLLFLGYGLVALPKMLWYNSDLNTSLKKSLFEIAIAFDSLMDSRHKLISNTKKLRALYKQLPDGSRRKAKVEIIINQCPKEIYSQSYPSTTEIPNFTDEKLVSKHRHYREALAEYTRQAL